MDNELMQSMSQLSITYSSDDCPANVPAMAQGSMVPYRTDKRQELTILLLGETGVGKSTFINAFINYLLFDTLDDAARDIRCLIPTAFTIDDIQTGESKRVVLGDPDSSESIAGTTSATKVPRCHKIVIGDITLNIIDTPGIGDTSGVGSDELNMQALLNFIKQYREINAICILLKPNNARVTVIFEYCILELLKYLNKSAANNILFLFTNSRNTFYRVGDTRPALNEVLDKIRKSSGVNIAFDADTTYCFDNEAFRYLVAISEPNCIYFDEEDKDVYAASWQRSVKQCDRMMRYIGQLTPHMVQETISVNNARSHILLLTKPLGDISKNISDNIKRCQIQKCKIQEDQNDVEKLKLNLFIPIVDIETTTLDMPITVCGDSECCDRKVINGKEKEHYKQICHKPCYLEVDDGSPIGSKSLLDCDAFCKKTGKGDWEWCDPKLLVPDSSKDSIKNGKVWAETVIQVKSELCFECGHSYQTHLHIFYETQLVNRKVRDEVKQKQIKTTEQAMQFKGEVIAKLEQRIKELETESNTIAEISATFAYFLRDNAIVSYNDAYEAYIKHLIKKEQRNEALGDDKANVNKLKEMLNKYLVEKKVIMDAMSSKNHRENNRITAENIDQSIQKLFSLKHTGQAIREHLALQQSTRAQAHQAHSQVVHRVDNGSVRKWFKNAFECLRSKMQI